MTERRALANGSSPPGLAFAGMVECHGLVFMSGCLGNQPGTRTLAEAGFEAEARQVFANVVANLEEAGLSPMDAVKITIYLTDLDRFPLVDGMFAEIFGVGQVARTTVEVSRLGLGASIEIDAIAMRPAPVAA